jgi:hypothetical protein
VAAEECQKEAGNKEESKGRVVNNSPESINSFNAFIL